METIYFSKKDFSALYRDLYTILWEDRLDKVSKRSERRKEFGLKLMNTYVACKVSMEIFNHYLNNRIAIFNDAGERYVIICDEKLYQKKGNLYHEGYLNEFQEYVVDKYKVYEAVQPALYF